MQDIFEIWTDGACSGNPGPGGWGVLIKHKNMHKELNGGEAETTNNRMELIAVIKALKYLNSNSKVIIYTDSQYVKNGITVWLINWKKNNWKNASNKNVKNKDLWEELEKSCKNHEIEWQWVKAHSGIKENEKADILARSAIPIK